MMKYAEPVQPAPAIVREQPASTGHNIAVNEEPVVTLKRLHDRHRRQDEVHKQLPNLTQEIEEAWTAKRQGTTHEEIRKRFRLLPQLELKEFDDLLINKSGIDARTWAVDIIKKWTNLRVETIKKYGQPKYQRRQRRSGSSSVAAA
jgi:hypothetical protein